MGDFYEWMDRFASGLASGDCDAVADLFHPDGLWRDLVSFGWTIATHDGAAEIRSFVQRLGPTGITGAVFREGKTSAGAFFTVEAPSGHVSGHLRLIDGKATTLLTTLESLKGNPEASGPHRPSGKEQAGLTWSARRQIEQQTLGSTQDPYVLVVGGGQSGLALAARLKALAVPTLVIDSHPRVGDQWRSRYDSLLLHDPVWYDHLPYLPFPATWPIYTPKDKMGDWLEIYAAAMELDVWTGTRLISATYDDVRSRWAVTVDRNGERQMLEPTQLVLALGNAGFPIVPNIPGASAFAGQHYHSSEHNTSRVAKGSRVAIIGSNNSAHDIAASLVENGASPTLIQRSSTLVVRQPTFFEKLLRSTYSEEAVAKGLTTELADLLTLSVPIKMAERTHPAIWKTIKEMDGEFYRALEGTGFSLDFAEDGAGMTLKYLRSASGYYIDVGASQMVIDGRIAVRSGSDIASMDESGIVFTDGDRLDADVIIYATGFGSMQQWVGKLISPEVADLVGPCWGYGSGYKGDPGPWEGELRNMWKPTKQPNLWFMGGNLQQGRIFSRFLAQQLKARHAELPVRVIDRVAERAVGQDQETVG